MRSGLLSPACRRCWRVDDCSVPVFHELAISNAKHVEGEYFVPRAGGRGRILPVVLVDDRDQIAFSGDDLERISRWGLRTWRRLAAAWATRGRCLRRAAE